MAATVLCTACGHEFNAHDDTSGRCQVAGCACIYPTPDED